VCTTQTSSDETGEWVWTKINRCPQAAGQGVSKDDADEAEEEDKGTKPQSSHIADLAGARATSRQILLGNFNLYTHKYVFLATH
jgi:hypothetical protein